MNLINRLDQLGRRGLARLGARSPGVASDLKTKAFLWLLWMVWLPFLIFPLTALFTAHLAPARVGLTLAGAALFVALYLWVIWRNALRMTAHAGFVPDPWPLVWLPLLALIILSVTLTLADGLAWEDAFIFTVAITAGRLPVKQALLVVLGEIALAIVCGGLLGADWLSAASGGILMSAAAISVICLLRAVSAQRELHAAREELAHLAVTAERLRIARDLHDLLGHSLSLIALKSELSARLAPVASERAVVEIRDIESVARKALQEVRETVTGYRQPTLANELAGAGEALGAAGIAYHLEDGIAGEAQDERALPAAIDSTLAWAVREGVTNVIRHSNAHRCLVRVGHNAERAYVEIADDGQGVADGDALVCATGNGLRGLAERVAALGGHFEAGPGVAGQVAKRDGGFRIAVSLPLERGATLASVADAPVARAASPDGAAEVETVKV